MQHLSSVSLLSAAVILNTLLGLTYAQTLAWQWNFPSTTNFVAGGGANTPTFYYTASPTVNTGTKTSPVTSAYGAVFQGQNVGCSNAGPTAMNTGLPFTIEMWVNVFTNTGDQFLFCENKLTAANSYTNRLCLHILNGALQIQLDPDQTLTGSVAVVNTDLGTSVKVGWNYIQVVISAGSTTSSTSTSTTTYTTTTNPDGTTTTTPVVTTTTTSTTTPQTQVSATVVNEMTCTSPEAGGTIIALPSAAYLTDGSFSSCVGAKLQDSTGQPTSTATTKYITASNYFTGIVSVLKVYKGDNSANFGSAYSCSCSIACSVCLPNEACPYAVLGNLKNSYDFTQRGSSWVATTASPGGGPSITLAQDWDVATPYYVDAQGLYFWKNGVKQCTSTGSSLKIGHGSFSASVWFRALGTSGTIFSLDQCGGASVFSASLGSDGKSISVLIGGVTVNFINYPTPYTIGWSYFVVSVAQTSATTSTVCANLNTVTTSQCFNLNTVYTEPTCQSLCVGNNFRGMIKSVQLNDDPLSFKEMQKMVTATGCSGGCTFCDAFTLNCNPTCAATQYWSGSSITSCTTCNSICAACFSGTTDTTCFACKDDLTSPALKKYIYSATTCNTCGDGYIYYPTEQCDDGNIINGDGCSSTCQLESLWTCIPCCSSQMGPSVCTLGSCIQGNNKYILGPPAYQYKGCDDGNQVNNDGCNSLCEVETGWFCSGGNLPSTRDTCVEICGDGYDFGTFPCDDGNTRPGDGCDATCQIEPGWQCSKGSIQWPDICTITNTAASCGTTAFADFGIWPCNDANPSNGDGCNSACEVERGWECTGGGAYGPAKWDTCYEVCGDGYNMKKYQCDDGNVNYLQLGNDGCSWSKCTIDGGFACTGSDLFQRDACNEICGDGFHMGNAYWNYLGANECDDGSQIPGDGCDPLCRTERGWQCGGGSAGVPDVCSPMCGDWRVDGSEHCDDGNLNSGDGCSSICHVEPGMECLGGNNRWRDDCQEICGDGRNVGYFVCDDGNTQDGDGCSSTCTLEYGFQCTGGTQWLPDTCGELCGKGFNIGDLECDDGNLYSGDGCSATCTVEAGYVCTPKYSLVIAGFNVDFGENCVELCGDGIMLGNMQCDDGNLINGDGCSSTCTIENCWICDAGSPTHCYYPGSNALGIKNVTLDANNSQIIIWLNNSGIAQSTFNVTKEISMNVDGPLAPYNYSWSVSNQQYLYAGVKQSEIYINIDWMDSQLLGFDKETVTLCFVSPLTIKHYTCNYYLNTSACYSFHPDGQEAKALTLFAAKETESSLATYGLYTALGQVGLGALISLAGLSAGGAWDTFYSLQFMHLLPTMSISLPSSATSLFQTFAWTNLQDNRLGLWLRNVVCIEKIPVALYAPNYNFKKQDYHNSYFMYNFADTLTILAIAFLVVPLLTIFKLLLPESLMFFNVDNFIRGRFLIAMINISYLKLCFTCLTNFFRFDTSTTSAGFNSYLCIIGLGYMVLVVAFYLTHIIIYKRELASIKSKIYYLSILQGEELVNQRQTLDDQVKLLQTSFRAKVLFSEYNSDSVWQYGYMLQFCFSRIIYALVLAYLNDQQDWQLFIACVVTILSMVWIAQFKPYSYPFRNALAIINEIFLFYVFTAVAVLSRADINKFYWAGLTIPIALTVTAFIFAHAAIWIALQCVGCYLNRAKGAPIMQPKEDVKRDAILRKQYKNVHKKVQEEKLKIKEEQEAERKRVEEEEKKKKEEEKKKLEDEELKKKNKINKADDDLVAELPEPEEQKQQEANGPKNRVHPEQPKETPRQNPQDKKQPQTKNTTKYDQSEDEMEEIDLTESRGDDYSDGTSRRDGSEETSRDLSRRSDTYTEGQDETSRSNTEGLQSIDSRDQSQTNSVPESSFYGTTQQR